jgi:hypothetical protein
MKLSRFEAVYGNSTTTARKVYDATPISETWTVGQIFAELQRVGIRMSHSVITGCLLALAKDGLVTDSRTGWTRVPVRTAPVLTAVPKEPPVTTMTLAPKLKPIDKLGALAKRARLLSADLVALANDIEEAAVSVDDEIAAAGEGSAKLVQLRELQKGLA